MKKIKYFWMNTMTKGFTENLIQKLKRIEYIHVNVITRKKLYEKS
jgi:TolB-like protein